MPIDPLFNRSIVEEFGLMLKAGGLDEEEEEDDLKTLGEEEEP